MRLQFATLVARHRLWREWDKLPQPASIQPLPPFWDTESMLGAQRHGVTEVFSKVYVEAPDRFRVETGEMVWLSSGGRWWKWGGTSVPMTAKASSQKTHRKFGDSEYEFGGGAEI